MFDRTEIDDLKDRLSIADIVSIDTTLTESARSYGGTLKGPCPWCGGEDRFHVHPADGNWWCRQCNRRGPDVIAYWSQRYNCDFTTAVKMLKAAAGATESTKIDNSARWVDVDVTSAAFRAATELGYWPAGFKLYHPAEQWVTFKEPGQLLPVTQGSPAAPLPEVPVR